MAPRRWEPGHSFVASGLRFRTVQGKKGKDDIRLDVWDEYQWKPVYMELAFALVDFFATNERAIQEVNQHWRQNGDRYFINQCIEAYRVGWSEVANRLESQRERRRA